MVWVSELAVCNSSLLAMTGRMEARPDVKNGEANISSALNNSRRGYTMQADAENEAQGDDGAHEVAEDHHAAAIDPVEHDACDGAGDDHGQCAAPASRR